jgi:hypothetical protein
MHQQLSNISFTLMRGGEFVVPLTFTHELGEVVAGPPAVALSKFPTVDKGLTGLSLSNRFFWVLGSFFQFKTVFDSRPPLSPLHHMPTMEPPLLINLLVYLFSLLLQPPPLLLLLLHI